jgi:methyl-accepting chemotaxis protein
VRLSIPSLNGTRLPYKFAALGLLALVLAAVPTYRYYLHGQESIAVLQAELDGVPAARSTLQLVQRVQAHRSMSAQIFLGTNGGFERLGKDRDATEKAVAEDLAAAEPQIARIPDPDLQAQFGQIKTEWNQILADTSGKREGDPHATQQAHMRLVNDLLALDALVVDRSRLALDPAAERSYLIRAAFLDLPAMTNSYSRLRGIGAITLDDAAARRKLAEGKRDVSLAMLATPLGDRAQVVALGKEVENANLRYEHDIQEALRLNAVLRDRFAASSAAVSESFRNGVALSHKEIVDPDVPTMESTTFFNETAPAFALQNKAILALADFVATDLVQKIEDTRMEQRKTLLQELALIIVGLGFAYLIVRSVTRPIGTLLAAVRRLESGDETARARLGRDDEVGRLGAAFDQMMDVRVANLKGENEKLNNSVLNLLQAVAQLARKDLTVHVPVTDDLTGSVADAINLLTKETAKVMQRVSEISGEVTAASLQVKAKSDAVAKAAEAERQQIDETAASLEQNSQTMTRMAELAQDCNAAAGRAVSATQQALTSVNDTVGGIIGTRDTIRETEKRIKRLGERSQEISVAVNLINSIAERTQILALNASMHAASAGEAGRGFAVVADEVQRLAENARQATQQIGTLVLNIQSETTETVHAMNAAITQVVEGSRLAERAGKEMALTQDATGALVTSVQRIAEQSLQQAQSTSALLKRAALIKGSTQETSRQVVEQVQQTKLLVEYARNLLAAVRVFKLSST